MNFNCLNFSSTIEASIGFKLEPGALLEHSESWPRNIIDFDNIALTCEDSLSGYYNTFNKKERI